MGQEQSTEGAPTKTKEFSWVKNPSTPPLLEPGAISAIRDNDEALLRHLHDKFLQATAMYEGAADREATAHVGYSKSVLTNL